MFKICRACRDNPRFHRCECYADRPWLWVVELAQVSPLTPLARTPRGRHTNERRAWQVLQKKRQSRKSIEGGIQRLAERSLGNRGCLQSRGQSQGCYISSEVLLEFALADKFESIK
jgi:hypothetical protein